MSRADLIIIGGGPAGLSAAIYGASEGLKTTLLESADTLGGQAGASSRIENFLGFRRGIAGWHLMEHAEKQARRLGAQLVTSTRADHSEEIDGGHLVVCSDGSEWSTRSLLVATGLSPRRLGIPGENLDGVMYVAGSREAPNYRGRVALIIGGANSAGQAALYYARYCRHVMISYRGNHLGKGMSEYLVRRIDAAPNISVLTNTEVVACSGESSIENAQLVDTTANSMFTVEASAMLVMIGSMPSTDWLPDRVDLDENRQVMTGYGTYDLMSAVPGIFAAGDVRSGAIKRVATAVGEGAAAVREIQSYLPEGNRQWKRSRGTTIAGSAR